MKLFDVTRRHLLRRLGLAGAAGLAGTAALGMERLPRPRRRNAKQTLDFSDPKDNLTGIVKMAGSLEAEDVPHYYYGTIYGLNDGKPPQPLIDLEGSEISYFHRNDDGSYRGFSNTISIFRDVETRQVLKTWFNPYTAKEVDVTANYLPVTGLYYHYSVKGIRVSGTQDLIPDEPLLLKWTELGDHTMVNGETQISARCYSRRSPSHTRAHRRIAQSGPAQGDQCFWRPHLYGGLAQMDGHVEISRPRDLVGGGPQNRAC